MRKLSIYRLINNINTKKLLLIYPSVTHCLSCLVSSHIIVLSIKIFRCFLLQLVLSSVIVIIINEFIFYYQTTQLDVKKLVFCSEIEDFISKVVVVVHF